jgi:hypothetical protein
MAMWRDPLDELIADLERAVPPTVPLADNFPPPMADYCFWMQSMMSDDPAERDRLAQDPRVKGVHAYHERLFDVRKSPDVS